MNIEDNSMETNAVIKSDGRVSVYRAMITQITCLLTMDDFPFDQQVIDFVVKTVKIYFRSAT